MARRKKLENMTYDERFAQIDTEIEQHKAAISTLKKERKELAAAQQQDAVQDILNFIADSGKTPSEFLSELKEENNA